MKSWVLYYVYHFIFSWKISSLLTFVKCLWRFDFSIAAGNVTCPSWPSQPCCSSNADGGFQLTSKFLCGCWGGSWDPVTDFRSGCSACCVHNMFWWMAVVTPVSTELTHGLVWTCRFDNLAMSMLTLFISATLDSWSDNMHFVADSTGEWRYTSQTKVS